VFLVDILMKNGCFDVFFGEKWVFLMLFCIKNKLK